MAGVDYYDLLGVSPQASPAEVKSAYRRLAKTLHPDAGGNSALFRLVTEAYDALSDPLLRQRYDAERAAPGTASPATWSRAESTRPGTSDRSTADESGARSRPGTESDRDTGSERTESASGTTGPETADDRSSGPGTVGESASARIEIGSLTWWELVDPDHEVLWIPRFGLWLRPFLVAAVLWLVLLGLLITPAVTRRGPGLLDLTALVPLGYVVAATLGWKVPRVLLVAAYLWAAGFAAFGIYTVRTSLLGGAWMLALAVGTLLLPRLGQRYLRQRAMDRMFTGDFREYNTFGVPGPDDSDADTPADKAPSGQPDPEDEFADLDDPGADHSGQSAQDPDHEPKAIAAPRLTAQLLADFLTRLPGARIFHRLSVPDPVTGELDHAVLCGHRLVLVNSAVWSPAHYAVDEFGNVLCDGHPMPSRVPGYVDALDRYRKLLPRLEIQAVMLVHPHGRGQLVCSAALDAPVTMMTPLSFVQTIGEWLAEAPYTVDRDAFRTVLGQLRD